MLIHSHVRDYEVILENNLDFFKDLVAIPNSYWVIDSNVYSLYSSVFANIPQDKLLVFNAIENNKNLESAMNICESISQIKAKRNVTLISVGGGIVQDITGFVASILYRGINWIFVPTTLLSACDSCIGSKTSLNYKSFKNLLGTFYPPKKLHICPLFFKTLTEKDYFSGLGEVVKFNIMTGPSGLKRIEEKFDSILQRDALTVTEFVKSSLLYKKSFIEEDEFDKGERIKLNFAHTFGHAIEVLSEFVIPHGTAVAIGMVMANSISLKRGSLSEDIFNRSNNQLLKIIEIDINLINKTVDDYISIMRKDKKQIDDSLTAVLISKYDTQASLSVVHDITREEIDYAIKTFVGIYRNFYEN